MVDRLRELMLLGQLSPVQKVELSMVLDTISRHENVAIALHNDVEIVLLRFPVVDIAETINKML